MSVFTPCQGKNACRDDGVRCLTCGRNLDEIIQLRSLIDQLASLAIEYDYSNCQDYTVYIAGKVDKAITYRRQKASESCPN